MRSIDNFIAQTMWEADERPCRWEELDVDEMAEWEKMAAAARNYVVKHLAMAIQSEPVTLNSDLTAALSMIVKNLAASVIRGAA